MVRQQDFARESCERHSNGKREKEKDISVEISFFDYVCTSIFEEKRKKKKMNVEISFRICWVFFWKRSCRRLQVSAQPAAQFGTESSPAEPATAERWSPVIKHIVSSATANVQTSSRKWVSAFGVYEINSKNFSSGSFTDITHWMNENVMNECLRKRRKEKEKKQPAFQHVLTLFSRILWLNLCASAPICYVFGLLVFVLFCIFIERSYKNVSLFLPKVCWYCCCLFTNTGLFLTGGR